MRAGELIAEKYRVERVIGQGGMGVVVAAVHVELGQRVAIKCLLPKALENLAIAVRFEREARAAATLTSDHVSKVFDVGRLPDGATYIVMELLEGADLADELRRRGPLPVPEAATYVLQACDAISEAHTLGIVHRDLKPSNLFLAKRPKRAAIVKVLDFGISKSSDEGALALTQSKDVFGSPLYMSPEQLRASKDVDGRSDIWSLGATLYELVSGVPPFQGETLAELSANMLMTPLRDVRTQPGVVDLPGGLAELLERCLAKEPSARYVSVDELSAALAPFATLLQPRPSQGPAATVPMVRPSGPPSSTVHVAAPASVSPPVSVSEPNGAVAAVPAVMLSPTAPTRARKAWQLGALVFLGAAAAGLVALRVRDASQVAAPAGPAASSQTSAAQLATALSGIAAPTAAPSSSSQASTLATVPPAATASATSGMTTRPLAGALLTKTSAATAPSTSASHAGAQASPVPSASSWSNQQLKGKLN